MGRPYPSLHKISHATNKDGDTSARVNLLHGFTLNNNQAVFAGEKAYNLAISNGISNSGQLAFIIVLLSMT